MYVRCLRGRFAAERYDDVSARLTEIQEKLTPAIRKLPGLIDYYAGIDRAANIAMSVSVWDTAEHAAGLEKIAAGSKARKAMADAGVEWDPVDTFFVGFWVQPV
jgi:hypothetical protein